MQRTTNSIPSAFELQAQKAVTALNQGRHAAALKTARAALKKYPRDAYLSNLAGLVLIETGDARAAVPYFLTARQSDPVMIEAAQNLAQALILCAETDKAAQVAQKALAQWPRDPQLLYLAASAPFEGADPATALVAADAGLVHLPQNAALHNLRARALDRLGRTAEAELAFEQAIAAAPKDPEVRRTFAGFLIATSRAHAALAQVKAGLAAAPDSAALLLDQASLQQQFGDTDAAIASYRQVLVLAPDNPMALNGLAYLVRGPAAQDLCAPLAKALRAPGQTRDMKIVLSFAQARLAEITQAGDAAEKLSKANSLAAKAMPYDPRTEAAEQDMLLAPFEAGAACPMAQDNMPRPIFIIGLLRSGTTLAEQVLARHSDAITLGEWPKAGELTSAQARAFADHGTAPDGAAFAAAYLASLPPRHRNITHVIDKMPDNFRALGYLLNAFPNAVVIEMQRDPRDVAMSMWRDLFPVLRHAHTNSWTGMAAHMNLYARFMQRWRGQFAQRIHTIAYGDLVTDMEQTTRRLAELCGLDWQGAMRHPDQGDTPVMTASVQQVRQPVHTRSLNKWRGKEAMLATLTTALDPILWPQIAKD